MKKVWEDELDMMKGRERIMAKLRMIKRMVNGNEKAFCETCKKDVPITTSIISLDMPYCSECGRIVLDASQKYCCWCGEMFEES